MRSELNNENDKLRDKFGGIERGAKKSMEFVGKTEQYIKYGVMERDKRDIDAEAAFEKLKGIPIELIQEDNKRLEKKRNELKARFDALKEQAPDLVENDEESEKSGSEDEIIDESEYDGGDKEEQEDESEEKEQEDVPPGVSSQQNNMQSSTMQIDE